MKFNKKFLSFLAAVLFGFSLSAQADVALYNGNTKVGDVYAVKCSTGLTCTKSGSFGIMTVAGGAGSFTTLTASAATTLNGNVTLGDAAADLLTFTGTIQGATPFVFEGTTADAFETSLVITDPTADQNVTVPNFAVSYALVGSTLTTNSIDAANSTWFESGALVFEGTTADGFEGRITSSDWTADRVHTLPDMTGAFLMSTLATNNFDAANSIWAGTNGMVYEGATADAFETTISPVDPTADQTWNIPNFAVNAAFIGSTLTTNNIDAANSFWGVSNGLVFEGATADSFETTLAPADPLADETVTIPNTTGAAATMEVKGTTVVITAGTTPTLTIPVGVDFIATDTIITDNQDQTITFSSGGTVGQECQIVFQTDSGGSNDEVITFQTTLTNTTGTLTLANLTANRYVINFKSDGTVWNEVSRTGAQT